MRKQTINPYQTSFGLDLETVKLPVIDLDADVVREAATFTINVPEHVPVYTVTLRLTDVASLKGRANKCSG